MEETVERPMNQRRRDAALRAELAVVFPTRLAGVVPVGWEPLVLGRQPGDSGHALDDPTVSRRHFAVRWDAAANCHVGVDLGSRNGSRVDGKRAGELAGPAPLGDGTVVRVGDVILVYQRAEELDGADGSIVNRDAVPGDSPPVKRLRSELAAAARDRAPLLLIGETGTGKELIAREAHRLSGREGPFLAINCAALSRELIESQLFGHAKGAFTGAVSTREGLFRAAAGGTLLLDEVGELPLELQPKLLRVLQEREVLPVGETAPIAVDVRVLAATLRDVSAQVADQGFRLDLYARLSAWEIRVPSLRQRRADILGWLARFHHRWLAERERPSSEPKLDADGAERILLAPWPDNLRGLERMVHRVCSRGPDAAYDLPADVTAQSASARALDPDDDDDDDDEPGAAGPRPKRRPRPSREELEAVLAENGGSVRATARHFGRDRRQVYRWLEHYGLKGID
jgi:transcriptional regulator with GAF, ATPase, and Fis domain